MYLQTSTRIPLRVGDELRRAGLPAHVMTYVGPLGPHGEDVLDAPKNCAAHLIHLAGALSQGPIFLGQRGPESWEEQREVRERALFVLGTVNNPFGPNCEHISSYVRTGISKSPQLGGFGILALVGAGLFAIAG